MTFGIGILCGQAVIDTFIAAVALAVAMIPEGLPAALTVTLAIGVSRMARRRAIIRRLPAVETLGSVTVICSDKTGTLTQNQMTVQEISVPGAVYWVTGTGYAPVGEIQREGQRVSPEVEHAALLETLKAGLLCNDSRLVEEDGAWRAQGDPTEVALIAAARKAGLTITTDFDDTCPTAVCLPRLDAIPFESKDQYMATLHNAGEGRPRVVYVKGSVEAVLGRCTAAMGERGEPVPLDAKAVHRQVEEMAKEGLRVLAFGRRELPPDVSSLRHEDLQGLVFLGLQGFIDPLRPEAIAAVRACQTAGIRVKMITGDHALTAAAIARELGLDSGTVGPDGLPEVMTGSDLVAFCDEELIDRVERVAVFARVSPEQKLRLVEAFQMRGHIVAMTGDGVNDAPALKQADVGIAMGITGTDVAKETADMVITDDNFATIEAAVEEGRRIFDNTPAPSPSQGIFTQ